MSYKSALYSQKGGQILAYKDQSGRYIQITDPNKIPNIVDLSLPVQQLSAGALAGGNIPMNPRTNAPLDVEDGKIHIAYDFRGNPLSIPYYLKDGVMVPVAGFTDQDRMTITNSPATIEKVRQFANQNTGLIKQTHPDTLADFRSWETRTKGLGTQDSMLMYNKAVSLDDIKKGTAVVGQAGETLEQGKTGTDFLKSIQGGNLITGQIWAGTTTTPTEVKPQGTEEEIKALGQLGIPTPTQEGQRFYTEGYTPGYKGIYKGKEKLNLNKEAVNELFKQYHNRNANAQELAYWTNKKVGDLEDTLAKTTIFSGDQADKIREQMMAEGKTYIANQAELENLAKQKGVVIEKGQGSMLFTPAKPDETQRYYTDEQAKPPTISTEPAAPSAASSPTGEVSVPAGTFVTDRESANKYIDDMMAAGTIPPDIAQIYKNVIDMYPEGIEYNPEEIINAFNKVRNETIDPYYRELTRTAMYDFTNAYNQLAASREQDLQAERYAAGERIRQAKAGLEKAGMTFTGKAIEQLGAESAYPQAVDESKFEPGQLPAQIPFGGLNYEGIVPMQNRLIAQGTQSGYMGNIQKLGSELEKGLGSEIFTKGYLNLPGYTPIGGLTGSQEIQKQQQYGGTLNQIISNYMSKQNLMTNQ